MAGKKQQSVCVFMVIWLLLGLTITRVSAQAANDPAAALEVIARLNQWRLQAGAAPLKPNDTLTAMAVDQATYLSTLPDIPNGNALHLGRNGEGVRERALYPQFNWPTYGGSAAVAEVAAVGTLDSAMQFWQGSDLHRETITNPAVREIGVAAVPHPWGHIFIVDLGSRPDVLPALVDPRSNSLYLTWDEYKFGPGNRPPIQFRLFDSSGRPLGAWTDWTSIVSLPADVTSEVYVLYNDGSSMSLADVDLVHDQVILPDFLPVIEPAP